jgi:phenylacetate-CoA ligase
MHPLIVRKVLYPAYRALKRDKVLSHLAEMRRVQYLTPDLIRQYQWDKLKRLLEYASRHVPYYRETFKEAGVSVDDFTGLEDLECLPIVRKQDIKDNADAFVSEVYPRRLLDPDRTSGSTGESLYFFVDRQASEARRANNVRMNEWMDIVIGDKTALLWGTSFDLKETRKVLNALRGWLSNTHLFSAYTMDVTTLSSYLKALRRFRPSLLIGYPSALTHFAQSMLELGQDMIRPKVVQVSGETLYDWQREVLEDAFKADVYDHYGCREFGALARECRMHKGFHIACERVVIEARPAAGAEAREELSELLITDLDNFGMPFIRYAIEDLGTITWDECECGLKLPRLSTTIGRTFDVIRAPNGNYLLGTFWSILLKTVKGVERFQVIQEALDKITIALVPTDEFSDRSRDYVVRKIREACGPEMKIRFEIMPDLAPTAAGKYRFVISKIGLRSETP